LQQQLAPKKGQIKELAIDASNFQAFRDHQNFEFDGSLEALKYLSQPYEYIPSDGMLVGEHNGAHYYTIGQRKGLAVGGKPEPLFVIEKDTTNNVIYTGQGENHPGLMRKGLFVEMKNVHWVRPDLALSPKSSRSYLTRIRYRQPLENAELFMEEDGLYIIFEQYQKGIASGQFVAWYDGEELIGSGEIS
jgi:tRNA-specific 2-thiouridylase